MCAAGMSEERLREIVREEILAARLAEEDHEHPELQHDHYGLAPSVTTTTSTSPTTTTGSTPSTTTATTSRSGADRGGRQLAVSLVELALGRL